MVAADLREPLFGHLRSNLISSEVLLARADEVIMSRGQQPTVRSDERIRTFGPRWQQFFFYHPFCLVSRTTIRFHNGRLYYTLHHPLILMAPILMALLSSVQGTPIPVLVLLCPVVFHSGFLFFVHREFLAEICAGNLRGQRLMEKARNVDRSN